MCTCRLATKNLGCQVRVHNLLDGALFVIVLLLRGKTSIFARQWHPSWHPSCTSRNGRNPRASSTWM